MHKNATVPIIAMLDCSELDMEILDIGIKTVESNDCRKVLRDDGDANSMLATMQKEARSFHKDR